jgi:hypothetical protein
MLVPMMNVKLIVVATTLQRIAMITTNVLLMDVITILDVPINKFPVTIKMNALRMVVMLPLDVLMNGLSVMIKMLVQLIDVVLSKVVYSIK